MTDVENCAVAEEGHDAPKAAEETPASPMWWAKRPISAINLSDVEIVSDEVTAILGVLEPGQVVLEGTARAQAALLVAVANAKGEFSPVFDTSKGQYENRPFMYTPMRELQRATVPALAKYGLSLLQIPAGPGEDKRYRMHNWLTHRDGAILKSVLTFEAPTANDANNKGAKQAGAIFTYMARYFVKTFWGLDGGEAEDVDAPDHNPSDSPKGKDSQKAPGSRQAAPQQAAAPKTTETKQATTKPAERQSGPSAESSAAGPDPRQTTIPGAEAPQVTPPLDDLKAEIRAIGERLGLTTVEALMGYAEKQLKKPFEEIRNDYLSLTALHHAMKVEVQTHERNQPANADDPRVQLMEQVHELGRRLGMPQGTTGRIQRAVLAQYAYANMGGAILDDVVRDPAEINKLITTLQSELATKQESTGAA